MNEAVATEVQIARARLGEISAIAVTPSAVDLFQRFRATPAAERPAFMRKVRGAMQGLGIPGEPMEQIFDPQRESDRQAVARQLARP